MMITGGGVTCVCGVVVLVIVVVGVARIIAQCLNEELVVVDAEGIDDVGEGASGGRWGRRHDPIFIGFMCPRNYCNAPIFGVIAQQPAKYETNAFITSYYCTVVVYNLLRLLAPVA
jgi:hypothetical protein